MTERIAGIEKDIAMYDEHKAKCIDIETDLAGGASASASFPGMTINDVMHTEKEPAAKALIQACKGIMDRQTELPIGEYMGFQMSLQYESFGQQIKLNLRGAITYTVELGADAFGNMTRINNELGRMPEYLNSSRSQLDSVNKQVEAAKIELEKPFTLEEELQEKEAQLALLNAELNIDGDGDMDVINDADERNSDDPEPDVDDDLYDEPVLQSAPAKITNKSLLSGIQNFDSGRNSSVPGRDKPTSLAI